MTSLFYSYPFLIAISTIYIIFPSLTLTCHNATSQQALEFHHAYQYTMTNAMKFKAAEAELGIRDAERLQAGFYPNPSLSMSVNDIGQSTRWDNNEITIGLTQQFELGGKRLARLRFADAAHDETSWNLEIIKCDLYVDLLHAFINMAIAQERLAVAVDLEKIATQSLECISCKAIHGKASPIDIRKSEIASKTSQLQRLKRQAEIQQAKIQLGAFWNDSTIEFENVNFPLFDLTPPSEFQNLAEELVNNPELAKSYATLSKTWELIKLERTQQVPNMSLYVGVSTENWYQDPALNVGISIPLSIFDRNQGNIARATHEYNQAIFNQMDLLNQLKSRLAILHKEWTIAYEQAIELKDILMNMTQETSRLAEESYQLGNIEYLEFLETKTTAFDTSMQYLNAIEEYHHKRAEVLRLLAKCGSTIDL